MKNIRFKTQYTNQVAAKTWEIVLEGPVPELNPGQFVNVELPGFFLRRPFSVCDWTAETLTIVFKTVGAGTEQMSKLSQGTELDLLLPLGNGFDVTKAGERPLLVGGGAGVAPLCGLAKRLAASGRHCDVILGFNRVDEVFYKERFEAAGARVVVTTADGSMGIRGFATDALAGLDPSFVYACGPEPMLKAVYDALDVPGEYSFEARMGCGYGACVGCTRKTKNGYKRVCKDGPVFEKEEIVW